MERNRETQKEMNELCEAWYENNRNVSNIIDKGEWKKNLKYYGVMDKDWKTMMNGTNILPDFHSILSDINNTLVVYWYLVVECGIDRYYLQNVIEWNQITALPRWESI